MSGLSHRFGEACVGNYRMESCGQFRKFMGRLEIYYEITVRELEGENICTLNLATEKSIFTALYKRRRLISLIFVGKVSVLLSTVVGAMCWKSADYSVVF